jgi:RimJ/RimL family protein N-acetyltransferase
MGVCLKETGECIGDCGLIQQQINDVAEVEIGYHISKKHWRQGYASEAAQACKEYGFNELGLEKAGHYYRSKKYSVHSGGGEDWIHQGEGSDYF